MQLLTKHVSNKSKALAGKLLKKLEGISKPQKKFFISTMILFLSMRGRYNFKGMERYGEYSEKSYRLHFEKDFDFFQFNMNLWFEQLSEDCILAFDPSYLPKSGKHTPGKGIFYSGCLGKATGGLEIGGLGIVDLKHNTAFNLEAIQTPNPKELKADGLSLVEYYAGIIINRKEKLIKISKYLAVDGYFAKQNFVKPITESTQIELICKLPKNANLKYLYKGPKKAGRGRPRLYDKKVDTKNIDKRRFKQILKNDRVILFQAIVWSVNFKRKINVVYAEFLDDGKPTNRYGLFFSTDLELDGQLIYNYYKARFQIEFLFRDAKQFTGLTHCQARSKNKLYFHFNMALSSVGIAKSAHYLNNKEEQKASVSTYSLSNIKTSYFNELMLNLFLSNFQIDPTLNKNKEAVIKFMDFGKIAS